VAHDSHGVHETRGERRPTHEVAVRLAVVAQVECERHILKPGLMFKGKGLKPVAFKPSMGQVNRVQLVQPTSSSKHSFPVGQLFRSRNCSRSTVNTALASAAERSGSVRSTTTSVPGSTQSHRFAYVCVSSAFAWFRFDSNTSDANSCMRCSSGPD
jgi:hypothetical protein